MNLFEFNNVNSISFIVNFTVYCVLNYCDPLTMFIKDIISLINAVINKFYFINFLQFLCYFVNFKIFNCLKIFYYYCCWKTFSKIRIKYFLY